MSPLTGLTAYCSPLTAYCHLPAAYFFASCFPCGSGLSCHNPYGAAAATPALHGLSHRKHYRPRRPRRSPSRAAREGLFYVSDCFQPSSLNAGPAGSEATTAKGSDAQAPRAPGHRPSSAATLPRTCRATARHPP